jgi:DNA-binding NarL/FixJ family response regulator
VQEPGIKVIVLTTYADDRSVIEALRAGARGYLTKDAGADEIQRALQQVITGQAVIDPAVQHHLVDAIAVLPSAPQDEDDAGPGSGDHGAAGGAGPGRPLPNGLTPREAEVLQLIAAGLSNAEIAGQLVVSEATVKSHINHLLAKIGARDRAQAVSFAYQNGIASAQP